MAKCRLCKTDIPEGEEYCKDCLDKKDEKAKESYLDSLLNSVKNTDSSPAGNYMKKQTNQAIKKSRPEFPMGDEDVFTIDANDLEDFEQIDIASDLEDDIIIRNEDLFGEDFVEEKFSKAEPEQAADNITEEQQEEQIAEYKTEERQEEQAAVNITEEQQEEQTAEYKAEERQEEQAAVNITEEQQEEQTAVNITEEQQEDQAADSIYDETQGQTVDNIDAEFFNKEDLVHVQAAPEIEDITDPGLGELLNGLNLYGNENDPEASNPEESEIEEELNADEEDILNLLNQFDPEDPLSKDVKAISRMLGGKPIDEDLDLPADVGEVFSDALKVVSSLEDSDIEEELSESIEEGMEERKPKKIKKSKSKKRKKVKHERSKVDSDGKSVVGKLFGNVEDDKTRAAAAKMKLQKEEAAVTEEQTGKKGKKSKGKKGVAKVEVQGNERPARPGRPDEEKQGKEEDKKAKKKDKKKEKKNKKKEVIQVIDELDIDEGRINRLGASIIFLFFGIMVMILLIGTNIFTYSLNIKNANNYFTRQKYSLAYNEVYGMEIKDEDVEIYDKIMTVMFVNKQLNSYNNYYAMEKYPEALDSLLKGLSRYDKYIELATILGIKTDLDYVRNQICAELNNVFSLSEEESLSIINSGSQADYSIAVYDAVLEKR